MSKLYIRSIKYREPEGVKNEYPFNLSFIPQINDITFDNPVTFIIGENGSGKSTIIECLAMLKGLNMEGGSKHNTFSTHKSYSRLHEYCSLVAYPYYPKDAYFYRAESYYNLITDLDNLGVSDDLFQKDLHNYSRGEGFVNLTENRFFGNGIYLLDEPESGLSFQTQLRVLIRLNDLVEKDSQFIISTHSPILLMYPNAVIYELTEDGIHQVKLEDTELFQNWQLLMERKEQFIKQLFI